ncbi:DUF1840 domain-containing protein [Povalibacter sp.]|uniref:DUF1840 domain-containing protein n=1 Tax=Povalibacter sp. TaxID=1962978 RepID=UPI002F3FDB59
MLVTFRSKATGSVTMFGDTARQLLSMMGATGRIPAALTGADVGDALNKLQAALTHTAAPPAMNEDLEADEEQDKDPPVELTARAAPLIDLLQRAAAANAEVVWEVQG